MVTEPYTAAQLATTPSGQCSGLSCSCRHCVPLTSPPSPSPPPFVSPAPLRAQALEVLSRQHGLEHTVTVGCMVALAACMAQRGRTAAGEPLARRALAAGTAVHGESHPLVAACMVALAGRWGEGGEWGVRGGERGRERGSG